MTPDCLICGATVVPPRKMYCGDKCKNVAGSRRWAANHPDLVREQKRERHQRNLERNRARIRENGRRWREGHAEENRERVRRSRLKNPRIMLSGGERIAINQLPEEWRPVAWLIRDTRRQIGKGHWK